MSSIIFIESGQCGNQVGFDILQGLYQNVITANQKHEKSLISSIDSLHDDELDIYFRKNRKQTKIFARAVCLDTEPKVIHECMAVANQIGEWSLDPKSAVYRHGGAGNNWAMGYRMCCGEFLETAVNLVRREIEMCDFNPVLLSTHSMAGGTGVFYDEYY